MSEAKKRVYEINLYTPYEGRFKFRYFGDNMGLALDHQHSLNEDPGFPSVLGQPKFVGWAQDEVGVDFFEVLPA